MENGSLFLTPRFILCASRPHVSVLFALILAIFCGSVNAQLLETSRDLAPSYQFGRFPDTLFTEEFEHRWKGHDFVYVYKDSRADVIYGDKGFKVEVKRFVRGKFITEKGFPYGVFRLSYYHAKDFEQIDSIQVTVQTKKGERYILKPEEIQTIEVSPVVRLLQFAVPKAEEGSVFDFSYRLRRLYLDELPEFQLQEQVPVLHARSVVRNSQYFVYRTLARQIRFPLFHHVQFVDTSGVRRLFTDPEISYLKTETHYARNVPAVQNEPWQTGNARASLVYVWSEFGSPRQVLENSWAFAAADFAKRNSIFDESMPPLPAPSKIRRPDGWKKLFFQVRDRFTFNGADGIFPSGRVDSVASRNDINLELVKTLRKNGYRAFPALVRAESEGPVDQDHPGFLQFQTMMACLVADKDTVLLDAAGPAAMPGVIDAQWAAERALVIRESSFFWVDTKPFGIDRRELKYSIVFQPDGTAQVQVTAVFSGSAALTAAILLGAKSTSKDESLPLIWERGGAEQLNWSNTTIDEIDAVVKSKASFTSRQAAISFADGLDWFPLPVGMLPEQPFTSEWRQFSVSSDRLTAFDVKVEIKLPDRFKMAQPVTSSIAIAGMKFDFVTENVRKNGVSYRYALEISNRFFQPDEYASLQVFFQRWHQLSTFRWRLPK